MIFLCKNRGLRADTQSGRFCGFLNALASLLCPVMAAVALFPALSCAEDLKPERDEARFNIFVDGKEIGQEDFSIVSSGKIINTHSIVKFRDPGNRRQKIQLETKLIMDSRYFPQSYELRTNVDGKKGVIKGTFVPGEATFEYSGSGNPRTRGLMVGERFIVLDTNVFHHFVFVARQFDLKMDTMQSIEVVIPQELDGGVLSVRRMGLERIEAGGKKRDLHHLKVDSGFLQIDLWVDDQQILHKIALPAKKIEVIRKS